MDGFDFSGRKYDREWIKSLHEGMSKIEFCKHIYSIKRNGLVCSPIHRNTLNNWEDGTTSLPRATETFLSLVLFEYDKNYGEEFKTIADRNRRYYYARHLLNNMLGVDLYCRKLEDALFIQICRGVITFEDFIPLKSELETEIRRCYLNPEEKTKEALLRETENMGKDMLLVETEDEFKNLVVDNYLKAFAAADYINNARILAIYNTRDRYDESLPMYKAANIYAFRFRNTSSNMVNRSRSWLIDFCIHLRFNREEINMVLEATHHALLSEDPDHAEYYIRENNYCIGSGQWYTNNEIALENTAYVPRFDEFRTMNLEQKLSILLLLGTYIKEFYGAGDVIDCEQVDNLLELFLYDSGRNDIEKLDMFIDRQLAGNLYEEENWDVIEEFNCDFKDRFTDIYSGDKISSCIASLKNETSQYFEVNDDVLAGVNDIKTLRLLHYLAALYYTVFTGRYYKGTFGDRDIEMIRASMDFFNEDERFTGTLVCNLIIAVFQTFLSGRPVVQEKNGEFHLKGKDEKKYRFDLHKILTSMFEALVELKECTNRGY